MLNWNNTTLDIERAFNFHATRLLHFKIASGEQQVVCQIRQVHPLLITSARTGPLRAYSNLVSLTRGSVAALSELGINQSVLGASTFTSQVMAFPLVITSTLFATMGCIWTVDPFTS